ncbi:hypothetical protein FH972_022979 [Carpinus fangiana]|uniref:Magnesium transporter n=1 Tax=Carpinus fangiana TaxID=176857 RepID=A0A5N6KTU2_9ROSI|nr:hypothetical protein FH972_022979 [Carpinus fangiana]
MDLALDIADDLVRRSGGSSTASEGRPPVYKAIGISLAVASGCFIGVSFVLKKVGLLKANVKYCEEAGEGYGYLKNAWWWSGMTLMIIGEICNFVAYAFVDAILVTPLGALSVVITTILSAIFLKERLSFVGKVGCFLCIIGSVVIVLNSPSQSSAATIQDMQHFVIAPGFLSYAGIVIVGCTFVALWAGPRYGKKSMLVYLSVCSLIGGLSVVATQGLGAAIVTQIGGQEQFKHWFLYVLFVFVIATLVTEIIYLNKALNIYNAALVTPTYYVYFTSATIVTSAILFRGFKGTPQQITTIVMGFLVICSGVVLLQLSKSAKDVPDSKVFTGDLDQVRTVAEQEEHESEPKADSIRGAAAIIRTMSKGRLRREAVEAERIQHEKLQPIGENETVEWDGLRRRTTVRDTMTPTPLPRAKTLHYPLGMSHFPSEEDETDGEVDGKIPDHHPHAGLFSNFRRRAHTIMHPRSRDVSQARSISYGSSGSKGSGPHQLAEMNRLRIPSAVSRKTSGGDTVDYMASDEEDIDDKKGPSYGINPRTDTSYSGGADSMEVPGAGPPEPPTHGVPHQQQRRQFSFFSKTARGQDEDALRPTSKGSFLRFSSRNRGASTGSSIAPAIAAGETEEERMGLVHGDASTLAGSMGTRDGRGMRGGDTSIPSDGREEYHDNDDNFSDLGTVRRARQRGRDDDPWDDRIDSDDDYGAIEASGIEANDFSEPFPRRG